MSVMQCDRLWLWPCLMQTQCIRNLAAHHIEDLPRLKLHLISIFQSLWPWHRKKFEEDCVTATLNLDWLTDRPTDLGKKVCLPALPAAGCGPCKHMDAASARASSSSIWRTSSCGRNARLSSVPWSKSVATTWLQYLLKDSPVSTCNTCKSAAALWCKAVAPDSASVITDHWQLITQMAHCSLLIIKVAIKTDYDSWLGNACRRLQCSDPALPSLFPKWSLAKCAWWSSWDCQASCGRRRWWLQFLLLGRLSPKIHQKKNPAAACASDSNSGSFPLLVVKKSRHGRINPKIHSQ